MPTPARIHTRPAWRRNELVEPHRRLQGGLVTVASTLVVGWVGYFALGLNWFDALYQTVITVTTVGYSELGVDPADPTAYRVFTLFLVVVGVGSVLYTLGVLADTLIEGSLNEELQRRRMLKAIDELHGHTVVAGWGQVGHSVARYLERLGAEVVIIDREPDRDESSFPLVIGEATEDSVLQSAGIQKAATLVLALDHDADNLFVCLSARSMCPDLFIVARTSDQKNEKKFLQAGADRVINPHEIGGSRMGALAMRPHVAEFIDEVLHDDQHDVAVEEVVVGVDSGMVGRTLIDLRQENGRRSLIIAIRPASSLEFHSNPAPETALKAGDVIIALGSAEELAALRQTVSR